MRKPARKASHRSTRSSPGCVWRSASRCVSISIMCPRASFSPPARQPPWKSNIDLGRRGVNRKRAPFRSERDRGAPTGAEAIDPDFPRLKYCIEERSHGPNAKRERQPRRGRGARGQAVGRANPALARAFQLNEVISNRCSQLAGTPLGSKTPVHPNDDVNMAQSSNDTFPSAMYIAAAVNVKRRLILAVAALRDAIGAKAQAWDDIVKIGRTHMQDATPLTLGQEWSGYAGMLSDDLERLEAALQGVYQLALGGTAVGTGINSAPGFAEAAAAEIAKLTGLPFVTAPNKFTVQGAHDALVQLSGTMRTLAVSLYKIANDIRLMSCGPRAGFAELSIPENEPGSSIMPGKVNPTQAEALAMIAVQVMANDVAVGFGGAGGYLEMNVYKPLMIFNITHSITIVSDGCVNFRKFLIEGTQPNLKKIGEYVERSLMLVTALSPVIGYDKASKIAHYALDNDLTLKAAALKLGFVTEAEFDRVVDPRKMVTPYVASGPASASAA